MSLLIPWWVVVSHTEHAASLVPWGHPDFDAQPWGTWPVIVAAVYSPSQKSVQLLMSLNSTLSAFPPVLLRYN